MILKPQNRKFGFSWKDDDNDNENTQKETEINQEKDEKKKKKTKESNITKKKDTQVPLMPIPASECPIIPKFIHVHNSYTISEENYNELIELIRKMKSRNVAIFLRKSDLKENDQNTIEDIKESNDKEKDQEKKEDQTPVTDETNSDESEFESMYTDPMQPEKKRIQYFSFINIADINDEEKEQIKFNTETVRDVTDKFKEQLLPIGTQGILSALQNIEKNNGNISINFMGTNRCEIIRVLEVNRLFHLVEIKHVDEDDSIDAHQKTKSKQIMNQIQTLQQKADQPTRYAIDLLKSNYDLTKPSDLFQYSLVILTLSQFTNAKDLDYKAKLSEIFQLTKQQQYIDAVADLLNVMIEENKIRNDVNKNIEDLMRKQQKQEVLKMTKKQVEEQLNTGKGGLKARKLERIKSNFKDLKPPALIKEVFDEEFERLEGTDSNSSDQNVALNQLEILSTIPWGIYSQDSLNLKQARDILDRDHYGMNDVKDRIMEFISIGILKGSVNGKILCFNGPPGVGKTSIAKGIAEALGREFVKISLGGQQDTSELKGHRRTQIGSMPGKIIQGLRRAKNQNPVILLDEIDKCGHRQGQSDLTSTLLEILDFSQNDSFMDNYVDLPIDLSKVLFICTANDTSSMSKPLMDRLEVINLNGQGESEKMFILDNQLIKNAVDNCGLVQRQGQITISQDAKENMIRYYARESGVRSLEKQIKRVYEKLSYKIVLEDLKAEENNNQNKTNDESENELTNNESTTKEINVKITIEDNNKAPDASVTQSFDEEGKAGIQQPHFEVTAENLKDQLGPPRFQKERMYQNNPAGVSTGLAQTSMGGSVLQIETIFEDWHKDEDVQVKADHKDDKDQDSDSDEDSDKGDKDAKDKKKSAQIQGLKLTGNLGKTISESSEIAQSFAKTQIKKLQKQNQKYFSDNKIDPEILLKNKIHLHFPEGATPKDGPSAGITITCAILSLALNQPLIRDIGMTGEISLMGHVMQIGGLKEKLIAAKREGLKIICCPYNNRFEQDEIPDEVKEGIEVNFVKTQDEVFNIAFDLNLKLGNEDKL